MTAIKRYFHADIFGRTLNKCFSIISFIFHPSPLLRSLTDEFRSKVACENDNMPLMCNPYSRIAIYSASFGHTERESVQCGGQGGGAPGNVLINREESGTPSK